MRITKISAKAIMNGDIEFTDYAYEAVRVFIAIDSMIQKQYGMPCPDYEPECVVCRAWAKRNEFAKFICS